MTPESYYHQLSVATAFTNSNYLILNPRKIRAKDPRFDRKKFPSSDTIPKTFHQCNHFSTISGYTYIARLMKTHAGRDFTHSEHQGPKKTIGKDGNNFKFSEETFQQRDKCNQNPTCGNEGIHWHGTITARILPRDFEEFHLRKPNTQIINQNEKNAMLSMYRQKPQSKVNSANGGLTFSKGYSLKDNNIFDEIKTDYFVVLDLELCCNKCYRSSDSLEGAVNAANHKKAVNLVDVKVHLNRDAQENCTRSLQRLEISTAKKLQYLKQCNKQMEITNDDGKVINQRSKKILSRKEKKKQNKNINTLKSFIFSSNFHQNEVKNCQKKDHKTGQNCLDKNKNIWNISNLSSIELWEKVASSRGKCEENNQAIRLSLSCPNSEEGIYEYPIPSSIPLDVISCPPTILSVETFENFEAQVYVGVPLVVEVKLIFAIRSIITWFVNGEEVLRDSSQYTPTPKDVGKDIRVLIIPLSEDYDGQKYTEAYRFAHLVEYLPLMPIVSPMRDDWVRKRDHDSKHLRVLTYNILADLYASREKEQSTMYHHCELKHLVRGKRMPMILSEILAYDADIICLQEVDLTIYESLLRPVLEVKGYQGFYSKKVSTQKEGCAMFWSLECFELAEQKHIKTYSIGDLFQEENSSIHDVENKYDVPISNEIFDASADCSNNQKRKLEWENSLENVLDLLSQHDELRRVTCEKTGQILQVAILTLKQKQDEMNESDMSKDQSKKPERIVLANTHLFYHPMADHIRAIQAFIVCKKLDELRRQTNESSLDSRHPPYPLVFCGDLNSDPLSGAAQLLLTKSLSSEHHDCWKYLNEYKWEMEDNLNTAEKKIVSPPSIILPPCFPNLLSGCIGMPSFTHLTTYFVDTLDYIFVSESSDKEPFGFQPERSAQMPSEDEIRCYIAMPNEYMPSDHISLVSDLKWVTNKHALEMFYSSNGNEMN